MKIYEYRTICPCKVGQFKVGNVYMTAKRSEEESKQVKGEGVETVKNEHFTKDNESGVYTYKILHFKSRVPSFMRWALPDSYCHCHEQSWNSYPHVHTEYSVPGMGDDLFMTVDSYHATYKDGQPIEDNLLNLSKEELEMRKVVYLDILDGKPKPEKNRDLTNWVCPELNVNEKFSSYLPPKPKKNLFTIEKTDPNIESKPPEWTHHFKGEMMVSIKVVKINFQWKGLQTIVENFATNTLYHNLFLDNHRAMMTWGDKWANMSDDEVRKMERQIYEKTNAQGFERDGDDAPIINTTTEKTNVNQANPDCKENIKC